MKLWNRRKFLEFIRAVGLPILYLAFVVTEHYGFWDEIRGLNDVKTVAAQMNTSYDTQAQRKFRPQDKAWKPTLALIRRFSRAQLPKGREPILIARYSAILSGKVDLGNGQFAE